MRIREQLTTDRAAVRELDLAAFGGASEAEIAAALPLKFDRLVALVAEIEGRIIGHVMFSPVRLSGHPELKVMALGPMAVAPELQHAGIGSALVQAGLERCNRLGAGAVVVLGHPEYFARFGFLSASSFGIACEHEGAQDAFMVLELEPDCLVDKSGTIEYPRVFVSV